MAMGVGLDRGRGGLGVGGCGLVGLGARVICERSGFGMRLCLDGLVAFGLFSFLSFDFARGIPGPSNYLVTRDCR